MDIVTLRTKSQEELHRILAEQRAHLAELRLQLSIRELKNMHEIRATRRTIARIFTILNTRQAPPRILSGARQIIGDHKQLERVAA